MSPWWHHWKHAESSFLAIPVHVTDTDANIPSVQNPPTVKQRERKLEKRDSTRNKTGDARERSYSSKLATHWRGQRWPCEDSDITGHSCPDLTGEDDSWQLRAKLRGQEKEKEREKSVMPLSVSLAGKVKDTQRWGDSDKQVLLCLLWREKVSSILMDIYEVVYYSKKVRERMINAGKTLVG